MGDGAREKNIGVSVWDACGSLSPLDEGGGTSVSVEKKKKKNFWGHYGILGGLSPLYEAGGASVSVL